MAKGPRVSAKAVVIEEGRILLIKKVDSESSYYIFPGGGQDHGENLRQTICREVSEETGYLVQARELLFVRDYIGANHEFAKDSSHIHQIELYFKAELQSKDQGPATQPDSGQVDIEWVPLEQIPHLRVYPMAIRRQILDGEGPLIYLGDVN